MATNSKGSVRANAAVTRGRLTLLDDTGATKKTKEFDYNPAEIHDTKAINWGATAVAGASHPVYQYGSGGERVISFELFLDADRLDIRKNNLWDLTDELAWYRALLYPIRMSGSNEEVAPPIVLFTFGITYPGIAMVCKQADIKVTYFSNVLRPIRANVVMQLAEVATETFTSRDVSLGP